MAKYYITINGNQGYLNSLHNIPFDDIKFQDDHKNEFSGHIFIPNLLDNENSATEIAGKSNFILKIINGSYFVSMDNYQNLRIRLNLEPINIFNWQEENVIYKFNNDSKDFLVRPQYLTYSFPINASILDKLKNDNLVNYFYYLSKIDTSIENILLLFSYKTSYISLYCILDCLKTITGKKKFNKLCKNSGYTQEDIRAFTATANNYGVIGIFARHGNMNYQTPSSRMELNDAEKMFRRLVYFCLIDYLKYKY